MKKLVAIVVAIIILLVGGSLLYIKLKPQLKQKTQTNTTTNTKTSVNGSPNDTQNIASDKYLIVEGTYDYDKRLLTLDHTYLNHQPYKRSPNYMVSDDPNQFSGKKFVKLGITDDKGKQLGIYYLDLNVHSTQNFALNFPYKEEFSSLGFNFFAKDQDDKIITRKNMKCDFRKICIEVNLSL